MIQLFHVTKCYHPSEHKALNDVSFCVEKGELVFVTGPSGAGKSTLLQLLYGIDLPTDGQVQLLGRNVAKLKRAEKVLLRQQVGMVFQDYKLIATKNIFENVALALWVRGFDDKKLKEQVMQVLDKVELAHRISALPCELSGGEQQRVSLARALVAKPQVLLCDEPTGNLDPRLAQKVLQILTDAAAKGTSVLCATLDEALMRGKQRVIYLQCGRVVGENYSAAIPPLMKNFKSA